MKVKILKYTLLALIAINLVIFAYLGRRALPKWLDNLSYQGPVFQTLISTVYTARDVLDYFYLPFAAGESLPTYDIAVQPEDWQKMNAALNQVGEDRVLTDDLRIKVPAIFIYDGKDYEVEISFRGAQDIHWNADKKSYTVRFKKDRPFENVSKMALILPLDRNYLVEHLNTYRAEKFGFFVPESKFVNLKINNQLQGVYFQQESWSDEFLAKHGKSTDGALYKTRDVRADFCNDRREYYDCIREFTSLWELAAGQEESGHDTFEPLKNLFDVFAIEDNNVFSQRIKEVIDVDQWLTWNVHYLLVQSYHQGLSNLRFYYNPETELVEVIPWDVSIDMNNKHEGSPSTREQVDIRYNGFVDRLISVPEFRDRRNQILWDYVSDEKNLEDDLAFYDKSYDNVKDDFYRDLLKRKSSFSVNKDVAGFRNRIETYFNNLKEIMEKSAYVVEIENINQETLAIDIVPDSFSTLILDDISLSLENGQGARAVLYRDSNSNNLLDPADRQIESVQLTSELDFDNINEKLFIPYLPEKEAIDPLPVYRFFISVPGGNIKIDELEVGARHAHSSKEVEQIGLR